MNDSDALLKIENLTKTFNGQTVLDDVSLELERGKIAVLLGQNGAGKSTLIKLINNLLTADSGSVHILGHLPGRESKKHVAYLPERPSLDRDLKVGQMVDLYEKFFTDFDRNRAGHLLEIMEIPTERKVSGLSKGMQEKLQLALILSRKADLYILDEPLGGVDPASREHILDMILENFDEQSSMLISTHLISDVERIADRILLLDRGKIVISEDADTLRNSNGESVDSLFRRYFNGH